MKTPFQQGFVLIIVLFFLQLLSLYSIENLNQSTLNLQLAQQQWQKNIDLMKAHQMLAKLDRQISHIKDRCQIVRVSSVALGNYPLTWWQAHGCRDNQDGIYYYYVVESLGVDTCSNIMSDHELTNNAADYYRLTLFVADHQDKIILQSSVAISSQQFINNCKQSHGVTVGRQMWREL